MNRADVPATQAGLKLQSIENTAATITGELGSTVAHFKQRAAQREKGDIAMGHPRVLAGARKRIVEAVEQANTFGTSADYVVISAGSARSLQIATAEALGVLAANPA